MEQWKKMRVCNVVVGLTNLEQNYLSLPAHAPDANISPDPPGPASTLFSLPS